MKTNYTICHDFAHSEKDSESGSNIFFDTNYKGERCLYSYGYHFCISKRIGTDSYLFTIRGYSVTTSKHISDARSALSHCTLIFCPYPDSAPQKNFEYWKYYIERLEKELGKARIKSRPAAQIQRMTAQIRAYCKAIGERVPAFVRTFENVAKESKPRAATIKELERERAERERARKMSAERVAKWERGEWVELTYNDTEKNVPLRLVQHKGYKIIETGKGINMNVQKAVEFYKALKAGNVRRRDIVETAGSDYRVNTVNKDSIQIGCHRFQISYLDKFYNKLATL